LDPIYIYPDFFTSSSILKDPKNAQTSELFLTVYYFHQVIINIQQDAQDRHKFEIISAIKITTRQSGKNTKFRKLIASTYAKLKQLNGLIYGTNFNNKFNIFLKTIATID